jgi:hypothetical protein
MESALSFQYILVEHTGHRLVQYCRSYLKDEREQTRKWQNEIANVTAPWRADHERRIVEKRESVDGSEAFIAHFAALLPPSPAASRAWPGLYDICVALGKGVDYRTVHMAMCSQVHHDAEDILNDFIIGTASDYDPRRQNLERETGNFSIFLLLCSLRYYLECLNQLGARYRMPSVITQSSASLKVIEALAATVESEGFVSAKFDDFLPRSA